MSEQAASGDHPSRVDRPVSGGVQSVDRALDILEALAAADRPLGVSEIAELTGLAQGTAHRLLRALQSRGYVRHDATRKYALGVAATRLSEPAHQALLLSAQPHLKRLVALTGETANLAMLEGDSAVYVAQSPSPHMLRIFAEVGRRVPVHSTAVGKVLLAHLPVERAIALLRSAGLPQRTDQTITSLDVMLAELANVRTAGYALDDCEQESGVRCVAVPVWDGKAVVAAMSVSGPADRLSVAAAHRFAPGMQEIAERFSAELGGSPA